MNVKLYVGYGGESNGGIDFGNYTIVEDSTITCYESILSTNGRLYNVVAVSFYGFSGISTTYTKCVNLNNYQGFSGTNNIYIGCDTTGTYQGYNFVSGDIFFPSTTSVFKAFNKGAIFIDSSEVIE